MLIAPEAGHGMEWNGTEISVWNMEDARMEWNGRFQEWKTIFATSPVEIAFTRKKFIIS